MMIKSKKGLDNNYLVKKLLIVAVFVFALTLSISMGRYSLNVKEILILVKDIPKVLLGADISSNEGLVFYYIRLPRVLLAAISGIVLAGTGVVFQGVFKNPLASPDILGITSGCCFGAALAIILPFEGFLMIQLMAFVFGVGAVFLTYGLAKASKNNNVVMLVLSGMVVAAFFSAMLSLLKYVADPLEQLPAIVFWIMGGFHRASWYNVKILLISVVPCVILLLATSWKLNIIALGDEEAQGLGIQIKKVRFYLLLVSSFMVASCVSITGTVGWVALVIPHITRLVVGADHRKLLPMAMILGGAFTMLMDTLARTLTTAEIPISILTAAIGAPIFAYLLIFNNSVEG